MSTDINGTLSFVLVLKERATSSGKCGNKDSSDSIHNSTLHRTVRSANLAHAPANTNDSTRYLELYVAVDNQLYVRSGRDLDKTVQRVLNMVNYASRLFRQMNIYIALIGIEVWTNSDKFSVNGDAADVLKQFEIYRMDVISPHTPNDNANLFVAERFADATVGQGSVSMCVNLGGVAITADHYVYDWISSATTMVHELGHNFGLAHDDTLSNAHECVCPRTDVDDEKCIMYSKSDSIQPIEWSQCSIDKVQNSFQTEGTDYCLKNLPNSLTLVQSCGNYFVDKDEECDCGPSDECESKCCEPLTCRFTEGSKCATGECCDIDTCQIKEAATACREVCHENCDLPEYCDGTSEWCPADTYFSNGVECSTEPIAYCYEGQCRSRDTQCEFVWGDGSNSSIDLCYTKWNTAGEYYGNCGFEIVDIDRAPDFTPCLPENSMCGLLHCESENIDGVLGLKTHTNYFNSYVSSEGQRYGCKLVTFDVGLDTPDPGLVPDGAGCGEDRWCMEQQCVDRPMLPDYCNCSGEGYCNQYNECHCNDGLDPRDNCQSPGPGGSVRSGPQRIYLPTTTTTTATTTPVDEEKWITPLFVTLVVVLVVAAIITVLVIKRRELKTYCKRRKTALNSRYYASSPPEAAAQPKESDKKFASLSETNSKSSRRHDFISNPVLESTTNQTMKLRDISVATPPPDPISNPTYSSLAIESAESEPLTSTEDNGHTYNECRLDSDSDSEEVNQYEDIPVDIERG